MENYLSPDFKNSKSRNGQIRLNSTLSKKNSAGSQPGSNNRYSSKRASLVYMNKSTESFQNKAD